MSSQSSTEEPTDGEGKNSTNLLQTHEITSISRQDVLRQIISILPEVIRKSPRTSVFQVIELSNVFIHKFN